MACSRRSSRIKIDTKPTNKHKLNDYRIEHRGQQIRHIQIQGRYFGDKRNVNCDKDEEKGR